MAFTSAQTMLGSIGTFFTFYLPLVMIVLVIWYVSSAVGEGDRI